MLVYEEHNHSPEDASLIDVADLRGAYLDRIFAQADLLPLTGIDPKAARSTDAQLQLSAVYTALFTQTPESQNRSDAGQAGADAIPPAIMSRDGRERRMSAIAQLNRHDRLVLLGGPGSGKSTFVSFVTLCLAGTLRQHPQANLDLLRAPLPEDKTDPTKRGSQAEPPQPQPWDHGALLPIRVVLRHFAASGLLAAGKTACADDLWRFISADMEDASLGAFVPYLRKELLQRGGLLLLDGLDEVPEADERRTQIKQAVCDFAATYRRCRVLVTSRTYAYQNQEWRLPGFAEAVLQPFSSQQIQNFVDRWYAHVAALRHMRTADAQGRAELLKQRILANERLYVLAEQPLLLTLMASLHAWRGGSLPEGRVELYAEAVELLLDTWESQRVVRNERGGADVIQPSLAEFLKIDRVRLMKELYRLAYNVHARQEHLTGTADIAQGDLVTALLAISNADVRPKLLIEYLSNRAGLLASHGGGVFQFPHRTFQEYLAACHLTDDEFPDLVAELGRADPNRWREVVLLAGAKAAGGTPASLWLLGEALCYRQVGDPKYEAADAWGALLAGQALVEGNVLAQVNERNKPKLQVVREGLLRAMGGTVLPATDRVLGGQVLAKLSGLRVEVTDPLALEMCYVPAGPLVMGSQDDPLAYDDERPQHEFDILYEYWIGRYPVTVAQYGAFATAGGYAESKHWVEAAQAGLWQQGKFGGRDRPYSFGEPFELANHPVVGVSWYEALAFVRWLNEVSVLPAGYALRLPNEPEWEKAARGGLEVPADPVVVPLGAIGSAARLVALRRNELPQRRYPWGDEADPERANYGDTKIGSTSAVGCFPRGASPYRVEELSGNVWEWTRSLWADYPYPAGSTELVERENLKADADTRRVVRGGAFDDSQGYARCAARYGDVPAYFYRNSGFRVVLSPFTSGR